MVRGQSERREAERSAAGDSALESGAIGSGDAAGNTALESGATGATTGERPRTDDELHAWVSRVLGVVVARRALMPGHSAPFDYLRDAFFEPGVDEPSRDCVVWANRGGGKTFLGAVATALDVVFKPGVEVRILAGSLEQASRMHAHLRRLFSRPPLLELVEGRVTERRLRLVNGSGVELLSQSQASVRGTRVQKLRCDEVELFDEEVWEAAQLTTRSSECGGVLARGRIECLSTMHVAHGLMHRLVEEAREGKRVLLRWGVVDVLERCGERYRCRAEGEDGVERSCPLLVECGGAAKGEGAQGHVSVADAISMKSRVSAGVWEAEMLCERASRSDSVLAEFDVGAHVVDGEPWGAGALWIGGMDFGIRSPTVVLWAAVDARGVVWVVDERVASGAVLAEHVEAIRRSPWGSPEWIGVDPAGESRNDQTGWSNVEAMRSAGLAVRVRRMGRQEGLELIRARLRPGGGEGGVGEAGGVGPRLFVHRRCVRLIESMVRYRYPRERPESVEPVKDGSDHAVDALRYMLACLDRGYRSRWREY